MKDLLSKSNVDLSALLPAGFGKNDATQQSTTTAKTNDGSFKLVFPSRPGGRKPISGHKITTPSSVRGSGGGETPAPKIQKGWPIRWAFYLLLLSLEMISIYSFFVAS